MARSDPFPGSGANHTGHDQTGRPPSTAANTDAGSDGNADSADTTRHCPECNGVIDTVGHEHHCTACGLIVDVDNVDSGPEWRSAASRTDETGHNIRRCNSAGRTETLHDHGLGTTIDTSSDAADRQLSRMQTLHQQVKFDTKQDRNLAHGFAMIQRIVADVDGTDSTTNRACRLFRRAQGANVLIGRSLELVAGASVYAACREQTLPRLPSDVADVIGVTDEAAPGDGDVERALQQTYGELCRKLDLKLKPLVPADHIPRITSAVGVHDATRIKAMQLARSTEGKQAFVGRSPSGVAAAALWLAGQRTEAGITQVAISDAVDVSAVTIRKVARLFDGETDDSDDLTATSTNGRGSDGPSTSDDEEEAPGTVEGTGEPETLSALPALPSPPSGSAATVATDGGVSVADAGCAQTVGSSQPQSDAAVEADGLAAAGVLEDEAWLREHYVESDRGLYELADVIDVDAADVRSALRDHGLPIW